MDLSNSILTEHVPLPDKLPYTDCIKNVPDIKKKHIAKQFESLLLNRILEQMNNTIGLLDGQDKAAMGQIRGIFNMYLSRHISDSGGFGLWKDIYKSLSNINPQNKNTDSINEKI